MDIVSCVQGPQILTLDIAGRPASWIAQAAVELTESLPPEIDEARRTAIRDRFTRRPRPGKAAVDRR